MASPTRFTHLCAARRMSSALPSNGPSWVAAAATSWCVAASAHTRLRKRACPSICSSLQSKSRSGGPAKST